MLTTIDPISILLNPIYINYKRTWSFMDDVHQHVHQHEAIKKGNINRLATVMLKKHSWLTYFTCCCFVQHKNSPVKIMSWLQTFNLGTHSHKSYEQQPTRHFWNNQTQSTAMWIKNNMLFPLILLAKITHSNLYYLDIYLSVPAHFKFTH